MTTPTGTGAEITDPQLDLERQRAVPGCFVLGSARLVLLLLQVQTPTWIASDGPARPLLPHLASGNGAGTEMAECDPALATQVRPPASWPRRPPRSGGETEAPTTPPARELLHLGFLPVHRGRGCDGAETGAQGVSPLCVATTLFVQVQFRGVCSKETVGPLIVNIYTVAYGSDILHREVHQRGRPIQRSRAPATADVLNPRRISCFWQLST